MAHVTISLRIQIDTDTGGETVTITDEYNGSRLTPEGLTTVANERLAEVAARGSQRLRNTLQPGETG